MSFDRMIEKIAALQNPTVAGLDPKLSYIPEHIKKEAFALHGRTLVGAAAAILTYNRGLIDALAPIVPAVKRRPPIMKCTAGRACACWRDDPLCPLEGHVRHHGRQAQRHRRHHGSLRRRAPWRHGDRGQDRGSLGADALTVNGYLGSDGIRPLLQVCAERDKGIFVLVKTSNASSGELQDQQLEGGNTVYRAMGDFCEEWGRELPGRFGYSGVGAVVGATYPAQLGELRAALPSTFFLVPGYGAQGGGAKDVAPGFDSNGLGAIVNASRSILCAWQKTGAPGEEYARAAAAEAVRMRDDIMGELGEIRLPE